MKTWMYGLCVIGLVLSCNAIPIESQSGDLVITITPGENWFHKFNFFVNNPPQFAIWVEDENGNYIDTLFVTRKSGTEGWIFNDGERRPESLPVWAHSRNIIESDGLYLPTKDNPIMDGITGATPKETTQIYMRPYENLIQFRIKFEINHSTDFNEHWPKNAAMSDRNWNGGKYGSGQPSLIYEAHIDRNDLSSLDFQLIGHGSPDGTDGAIIEDLSTITSALKIIDSITVEIEND